MKNKEIRIFCSGSAFLEELSVKEMAETLENDTQGLISYKADCHTNLNPEEKAKILLDNLLDPTLDILWAGQGGEGSANLIPYLEENKKKIQAAKPKTIIGFSDVTCLLIYLQQHYNWPCIHGCAVKQITNRWVDDKTRDNTFKILFSDYQSEWKALALNQPAKEQPILSGYAVGGNLSLINISILDLWQPKTHDKIIFLEDSNEPPHVIRRTLQYLIRIGFFDNAKAVLLGTFEKKNHRGDTKNIDKNHHEAMQRALNWFSRCISIPVYQTELFGHGYQNNPIPLFTPITIKSES